jgi:hypothetical protein
MDVEGCCSGRASANVLKSAFVGLAKLTTRLAIGEFPDIIITAKTVRLLVVFTFDPWNHDIPLKFMVGRLLRPLLIMVGVPVAVALHPNPDLSLHVEITVPLAAGDPVAFGSEASSHKVHPGKSFGENQDPTLPIAHPFEGPV